MSLSYNAGEPTEITYNGQEVMSITYNGVEVWSAGFVVDNHTLALLHFDSGVLTDAAGIYTWVTRSTPTLDTSNKKFGNASLNCTNGNIASANGNDFNFYAGSAFTLEGWIFVSSSLSPSTDFGGRAPIFCKWSHGNNTEWVLAINSNYSIGVFNSSMSSVITTSIKVPIDQWVHIALSRHTSGNAKVYINGVFGGETSANIFYGSNPLGIGGSPAGWYSPSKILIDEVRISDICRYTSDFTP